MSNAPQAEARDSSRRWRATKRVHVSLVVFAVALSSVLAIWLWPYINLPLHNPLGIVGPLPYKGLSPLTNVARYLSLLVAPTVGFLVARGWAVAPDAPERSAAEEVPRWLARAIVVATVVYVTVNLLDIFCMPFRVSAIDYMHEGETLAAALNYEKLDRLWSGTLFVHGLFYDPMRSFLAWKLFGHHSVGAVRLFTAISWHVLPAALAGFLAVSSYALRKSIGIAQAWATLAVILALVTLTQGRLQNLDQRDAFALGVAAVTIVSFVAESRRKTTIAGVIAGIGMFNTIERGAYMMVGALAAYVFVCLVSRARRHLALLGCYLGGIIFALSVAALLLGRVEFAAFGTNLRHWIANKDLMDGYLYPAPFTREPAVDTLPILLNAASLLMWAIAVPGDAKRREWPRLAAHTFIVAVACLFFRSALGRSDSGHIAYVATPAYASIAWCVLNVLPSRALVVSAAVAGTALLVYDAEFAARIFTARDNAFSFGRRATEFISLADEAFVPENDRASVANLRHKLANESCLFVFPTAPALYYLADKPSCTRFYVTWFVTPVPFQREAIAALEVAKPHRIVWAPSDKQAIDGFWPALQYSELDTYIQAHYQPVDGPEPWIIAERKPSTSE